MGGAAEDRSKDRSWSKVYSDGVASAGLCLDLERLHRMGGG